jgi:hypothetical protein
MQKRNDLSEELEAMNTRKEKSFQEFEQLSIFVGRTSLSVFEWTLLVRAAHGWRVCQDPMAHWCPMNTRKEKSFQEFEQLSMKNAQLAELNNQLVHQIPSICGAYESFSF